MTAGWRREASYPAYGRVLFVTAGWRREASYPAYGRVLFVGRISASAIRHFYNTFSFLDFSSLTVSASGGFLERNA
ncbi:hypothetical protein IVZ55_09660 [Salmonella enterica subsp. enterica serovar Worthington]|nr:hypothetical protein [Salmonella enterica subsp. enterica serovar Worthington]MBP1523213.1 hypothetical protein [Salmonella enterica subsp. enterica serovar Worthington]MBP1523496.1 hypothetical protein [Salmonella enterica subsp. enterica serovar Worthington]